MRNQLSPVLNSVVMAVSMPAALENSENSVTSQFR